MMCHWENCHVADTTRQHCSSLLFCWVELLLLQKTLWTQEGSRDDVTVSPSREQLPLCSGVYTEHWFLEAQEVTGERQRWGSSWTTSTFPCLFISPELLHNCLYTLTKNTGNCRTCAHSVSLKISSDILWLLSVGAYLGLCHDLGCTLEPER